MDNQSCVQLVQHVENDNQTNWLDDTANIDSATKLDTMPDDCLLQIFSSFHLMDLCTISETCKRLRTITQSMLWKFSYDSLLNGFHVEKQKTWFLLGKRNSDMERVFKNFGSCLWSISVDKDEKMKNIVLALAVKHCGDELKEMSLRQVTIDAVLAVELKPVFNRLQKLHLQYVDIEEDTLLFTKMNSLVELEVRSVYNCDRILQCVFPKLQRFMYAKRKIQRDRNYSDTTLDMLTTFILRHSALHSLEIVVSCDHICRVIILNSIVESCTKLQELTMDIETDYRPSGWNGIEAGHVYTSAAAQVFKQPLKALESLRSVTFTENRVHHL